MVIHGRNKPSRDNNAVDPWYTPHVTTNEGELLRRLIDWEG